MKKATLKKINLENFKGRTMSFDFSDGRTIIRGTNEAGKSTLTNAFFWLLMGVDAQDRTNYELYDSTLDFTPENAIPAVVEGVFDIDGAEYTFKRVAKQKWVRKRGKAEYEKATSDEYTFYIDGLAVSANVYKERIESLLAPIDKLKLMLNVRYYQTLDWKKMRKHFSDMVGIIKEDELTGDYSSIKSMLDKYSSVDAVKEKLRQDINPKKRAMETIESEIKGMKSMLPSLDGVVEAERERDAKCDRIAEIDKEIIGLSDANKPFIEKRNAELKAIAEKKSSIEEAKREWDKEQNEPVGKILDMISNVVKANKEIQESNDEIDHKHSVLTRDIERDEQHLSFLKEELERMRGENKAIKERTFDENQVCQSCGQPLPYEKVAEIRDKFYERKESDHKACVERGLKMKAQVESLENAISEKKSQKDSLPDKRTLLSIAELESQLALAKENIIPFETTDHYDILSRQLATMESQLTEIPNVDSADLIAEKKRLNDEIDGLTTIVMREVERERGEARIEAKEKEQSEVGIELARLEGLFDKCVEREREWASIVRDRANKHLHYSHVEMTELTKAGELVDVCTLTARGVGSGTQNNATQILIGVDLAQAFQSNVGINLPIFIDNAEGIVDSNLPDVQTQMVLLYVDEDYKTLTIC